MFIWISCIPLDLSIASTTVHNKEECQTLNCNFWISKISIGINTKPLKIECKNDGLLKQQLEKFQPGDKCLRESTISLRPCKVRYSPVSLDKVGIFQRQFLYRTCKLQDGRVTRCIKECAWHWVTLLFFPFFIKYHYMLECGRELSDLISSSFHQMSLDDLFYTTFMTWPESTLSYRKMSKSHC